MDVAIFIMIRKPVGWLQLLSLCRWSWDVSSYTLGTRHFVHIENLRSNNWKGLNQCYTSVVFQLEMTLFK